jgi:hypothetical protein
MACEFCLRDVGHDYRCPNYTPPSFTYCCVICGQGICDDEEYVENFDGEYAHYDCLSDLPMKQFVEWCGLEVKTMESEEEW